MRKSRKTFPFYNFFMIRAPGLSVHIQKQKSYPQLLYQQKLMHILIHTFSAIFSKNVDFKGFHRCE